ncbi:MAG TPA: glutamate synthase-related protein, partial [bacterium]|nr:glutamate synthase-related protein [bacterium]
TDPAVVKNYQAGIGPTFEKIDKLPFWTEEILVSRVSELKRLGAERVCFKTGPFDPRDLTKIIQIAIKAEVDLITFDGAGGGSGHSPAKMMNEWGIPTLELESILYNILCQLRHQGHRLPQVAIAGGFVMEDQVFKGLALGAPYVNLVAIGRGAMAAALVGKQVGNLIKKGVVPKHFQRFGATFEEIFAGVRDLKGIYGGKAGEFPPGAVGVYSYLSRVAKGLKEFMALNRKFSLAHIERSDLIPLTTAAACVTGLPTAAEIAAELVGY